MFVSARSLEDYNNTNPQDNFHKVIKCYVPPEPPAQPGRYETRNCYPVQSADERARIQDRLARLHLATDLSFPPDRVCYVYDELMLEHRNSAEKWHPEQPERIAKIMDVQRCVFVDLTLLTNRRFLSLSLSLLSFLSRYSISPFLRCVCVYVFVDLPFFFCVSHLLPTSRHTVRSRADYRVGWL